MDLNKQIKIVLSYKSTKNKWKNNHNSIEWKAADKLAKVVMRQGLNKSKNCGCIDDLFYMLTTLSQDSINQKQKRMSSRFTLKGMLQSHKFGIFTNDNITDEKAIEILKDNSKNISHFSAYPSDWEKLIGKKEAKKEVTLSPREEELLSLGVDELREMADALAIEKDIDKASHRCKESGLTKFILANE